MWPCSCGCLHPEPHPAHSGVTEYQHGRVVHRGTKGSNPLSSSSESGANSPATFFGYAMCIWGRIGL
jgi:hypothetical protein